RSGRHGSRLSAVSSSAFAAERLARVYATAYPCLKYWTARSWRSAAARVANVPRLRRLPVRAFFLREYSRYLPDGSLRIMPVALQATCHTVQAHQSASSLRMHVQVKIVPPSSRF